MKQIIWCLALMTCALNAMEPKQMAQPWPQPLIFYKCPLCPKLCTARSLIKHCNNVHGKDSVHMSPLYAPSGYVASRENGIINPNQTAGFMAHCTQESQANSYQDRLCSHQAYYYNPSKVAEFLATFRAPAQQQPLAPLRDIRMSVNFLLNQTNVPVGQIQADTLSQR